MPPSRSLRARVRRALSFGGLAMPEVSVLALATLLSSVVAAALSRRAPGIAVLPLVPHAVLAGEVWRLATWIFLERSVLPLLFETCLLFWLGSDLAPRFRRPTFVAAYVALGVSAGLVTTLVALVDADVRSASYAGLSVQVQAAIVAWGLVDPSRRVDLLVVSLGGRTIAVLTILLTVVMAAYQGFARELPALVAEALTVAFVYRRKILPPRRRRPRPRPSAPVTEAGVRVVRKGDEWVVEIEDERVER